tara:strand:- start:685 stop:1086 length:402 start_codon:yes stop_codon:yes gene_type:complete
MADSKIKISNGELLDRISILELKMLRIEDPDKSAVIKREFYELNPQCVDLFTKNDSTLQVLYLELARINGKIWDLENEIRDIKTSDKKFILTTKKIFKYKQIRNDIKNDINFITGSDYLDFKAYDSQKNIPNI